MGKLIVWLQGKKTIIGGSVLMAVAIAGAFFGQLSPVDAVAVAALGFSVLGLSAKANRHQAELLAALSAVAQSGKAYRQGDKAAALALVERTIRRTVSQEAGGL